MSIKQIYHVGGLGGVIYQLIGNSIMLSPMAFFLCYFYSIDEEKLTLGKGIIDKINKILFVDFVIRFVRSLRSFDTAYFCNEFD